MNDIFSGDRYARWETPLWKHDLDGGLRMLRMGVETHIITAAVALPLILDTGDGLLVEMTDGTGAPVAAIGVTPGWLRSERMSEGFGVTEETWREFCDKEPSFAISESPIYVARGVSALADPDRGRFAGQAVTARELADAYDVTDVDGSRPDCWGLVADHGWAEEDPEVIERYR